MARVRQRCHSSSKIPKNLSGKLGALGHARVCKDGEDGGAGERLRAEHRSPGRVEVVAEWVAVALAREAAQREGRRQDLVKSWGSCRATPGLRTACHTLPATRPLLLQARSPRHPPSQVAHHLSRHMHLTLLSGSWAMSPGAWHLQGNSAVVVVAQLLVRARASQQLVPPQSLPEAAPDALRVAERPEACKRGAVHAWCLGAERGPPLPMHRPSPLPKHSLACRAGGRDRDPQRGGEVANVGSRVARLAPHQLVVCPAAEAYPWLKCDAARACAAAHLRQACG